MIQVPRLPIKIQTDTLRGPMNAQPTTGPHASSALQSAISEVADSVRYGSHHFTAHASGSHRPVTQEMLDRLTALARSLGYAARQESISHEMGPGAFLNGQTRGWPIMDVRIHEELPAEQKFSTFCHEIAHILLGHNPRTEQEALQRLFSGRKNDIPAEEAACELAAAAVVKVAGLGDGSAEARFIAEKMYWRQIDQATKDAAHLAARVLWAAVFGHESALLAAA